MNAHTRIWTILIMLTLSIIAVLVGWFVNQLKVEWFVAGFIGALAIGLVFLNYRVGVVCLTVLMPWSWSPLLPQAQGFNIVTFLVLASLASLVVQRALRRESMVWLPREVLWCYLVPFAISVVVAWPQLAIGAANFPPWITEQEQSFTPVAFLKIRVIKPAFFVIYAFILGNAVRDSKKPELFIVALAVSALLPALAIINEVVFAGVDVTDRKHFLANLGLQVNEYGALLVIAAGPLLYIFGCAGASRGVRAAAGILFGTVTTALLMTASRGALVGLIVIVLVWLLKRRKFTDLLGGLAVVAVLVVVIPESVQERLTMGLDRVEATSTSNADDPLTKGRVQIWAGLAPEFFKSPLLGGGLSSTAWNSAVTMGYVRSMHPHNLYLEILLDMGIVGAAALAFLYFRYAQTMSRLSNEPSSSPVMRAYFGGAFAAFVGMLASGVSGGHYAPHPDQTFLWFSLGLCFAFWRQARRPQAAGPRKVFGLGVKKPVTLAPGSTMRR
jgi:O-antigen ligase